MGKHSSPSLGEGATAIKRRKQVDRAASLVEIVIKAGIHNK